MRPHPHEQWEHARQNTYMHVSRASWYVHLLLPKHRGTLDPPQCVVMLLPRRGLRGHPSSSQSFVDRRALADPHSVSIVVTDSHASIHAVCGNHGIRAMVALVCMQRMDKRGRAGVSNNHYTPRTQETGRQSGEGGARAHTHTHHTQTHTHTNTLTQTHSHTLR